MTREELEHRTEVQAAYLAGKPIQVRFRIDYAQTWEDTETPGFDWDHCEYQVKPDPWRAKHTNDYYYINSVGQIRLTMDMREIRDDEYYEYGNYFATQEEAQTVAKEIQELLIKHRKA